MNGDLCFPDKAQIAHEILAYLTEHPDAEDTLEGIVQWWLLERKIKYHIVGIKYAIDDLVSKGFLLEQTTHDVRNQYRINNAKKYEIHAFLSFKGKPEPII